MKLLVHPDAIKNRGMWNAKMKLDIFSGIDVCPITIKIIAIPLAMLSQLICLLWHFISTENMFVENGE